MDSKTNNAHSIKATERINTLCNTTRGLSDKDTKAVSYIIEKSSRIAAVTFVLADVLDANRSLASELQRTAIGLVRDAAESARSVAKRELVVSQLLALAALLDTAGRSGQLSRMNTETLADEISALAELINTIDWHTGRRFADEGLFGGEVPRELFAPEPLPTQSEAYQRHIKDAEPVRAVSQQTRPAPYTQQATKDTVTPGRAHYKERVQEIQKDRRATILGLVQRKDRISVRDVANVIKDCSEKTLQRELLALVQQGVLKKEGERRWSTYSLA
jgi:hypothetical protein